MFIFHIIHTYSNKWDSYYEDRIPFVGAAAQREIINCRYDRGIVFDPSKKVSWTTNSWCFTFEFQHWFTQWTKKNVEKLKRILEFDLNYIFMILVLQRKLMRTKSGGIEFESTDEN